MLLSRAVSAQPELVNFHSVRPPGHKTHTRKRTPPPPLSSVNIPHEAPCRYPAELRMCAPATFTHLGAHYSDVTHDRIRDVFPTLFPVPSTLSPPDTHKSPPPQPLPFFFSLFLLGYSPDRPCRKTCWHQNTSFLESGRERKREKKKTSRGI